MFRHGQVFRHPIPAIIAPPKRRCIVLYVPDDLDHIASFWGTLITLIYWWNWERDDQHRGTQVAQVWREVYLDAYERYLRGECGEECPPEPEPPKPPPSGMGSGAETGRLGFTLEELEDFFMGTWLRGQLAWIDGKLMYAGSGCEEWCEVPVLSGAKPSGLTPEEITALSDGSLGLTQWEESGQPAASAGTSPIPSENPFYTTTDANACAKASAFIDTMHQLLIDVRDGLEISGETAVTRFGLINGIAAFSGFLTVPAIILNAYTWFFGGLVGRNKAETIAQINTALDDLAGWTASYCALVPSMEPQVTAGIFTGNLATEKDYKALVGVLRDQLPIGTHVGQIFDTFPISAFLESVREKLPTQECKCSQYQPFGYQSPFSISWYELFGSENIVDGTASFNWGTTTAITNASSTSPDMGVERSFQTPRIIAHAGKKMIVELLQRNIVGTVPASEGHVKFGFTWGEIGEPTNHVFVSSELATVETHVIDLAAYFAGVGVIGEEIEIRRLQFSVENALDAGETLSIAVGQVKIANGA